MSFAFDLVMMIVGGAVLVLLLILVTRIGTFAMLQDSLRPACITQTMNPAMASGDGRIE